MRHKRPTRKGEALVVDIMIDSTRWTKLVGAEALLRRALAEAAALARSPAGEVAIMLTNDAKIRVLNRAWRGLDKPTNVLSFPAAPVAPSMPSRPAQRLLGDIAIAFETSAREAKAEDKPLPDHLAHLAVHGYLHLLGHDHASEPEATVMEGLEIAILKRLGIPNPYVARRAKG